MASLLELGVSTGKWDSGLKKAQGSLDKFIQANGGLSNALDKDSEKMGKFVQMMGRMESTAKTGKGQMGDYRKAIEQLTMQYNRMSDAQKKTIGQDYLRAIDQLKAKYHGVSNEMKNISDSLNGMGSGGGKMSGLSSVLGELGGKLGMSSELTGMLTTGTIGMTAAVTAGAAAVGVAAKAWADYNTELAKSQQDVTVITGLKGADADELTIGIRALVKTYDVDFRDAVNAANTLMTQFGATGDEALSLLRDGMQGMLQGDGPKLLSMIQQYAPAFRDAGVEASQLVAVIHNSEGGLFTDQNMNAIVTGIKNIRLMTDQTSEALAKLGIDGEDMTRKLNEGSMTIFDALKQVAEQLENTSSSSQAAGEVMQQVFGRQGTAAGTKLGEAIASLNLNLDETKRQTGVVGEGYAELVDANQRLEQAMRDCFGFDGWHTMAMGIKTELVGALADVLSYINSVKSELNAIRDFVNHLVPFVGQANDLYNNYQKYFGDNNDLSNGQNGARMPGLAGATAGGVGGLSGGSTTNPLPKLKVGSSGGGGRRGGGGGGSRGGRGGGGSHQETPQEKAEKMVSAALQNYAKTISMADMMLENGMINTQDYKKKELAAQERLTTAYAEAYNVYNDEKYKTSFEDAATEYRNLADVVKGKREEFEKAMEELRNMPLNLTGDIEKLLGESMEDYAKRKNISLDTGGQGGKMPHGWGWADESAGFLNDTSSALGQIAGGIEDLGIELPEGIEKTLTVMQAIAAILTGISSLVMIITTINATKSIPIIGWALAGGGIPKAAGGMLGGNSFSGDNIPVLVNSGELILNRAQQGNLASQLGGSGISDLHLSTDINAESLRIVLNNNGKRTGRGEYVTTNKRG